MVDFKLFVKGKGKHFKIDSSYVMLS